MRIPRAPTIPAAPEHRVVFLLAYAVAIWVVAAIYRRRWPAFVAVIGGLPPVAILALACAKFLVAATTGATEPGEARGHAMLIYVLAGSLMALITAVGLFIALQPRPRPERPCGACGYDLLGNLSGVCPECGADVTGPVREHRAATPVAVAVPPPDSSLATRLAGDLGVRERLEDARRRALEG